MSALRRRLWRWHFWAGLIVAPFLLILSATGALYLFKDDIADWTHPEISFVATRGADAPVAAMARAAMRVRPGAVTRIDLPGAQDRPAIVFVAGDRVHVDPHDTRVLGIVPAGSTIVDWAEDIHGTLLMGSFGDALVELAACWALVLVATGVFLWWPRGGWRTAGLLWPRWSRSGRGWWRDLHAPVGVWSAALIAFLIFTGLPWAGVQGDVIRRAADAAGIGYPASYRTHDTPASAPVKAPPGTAPWTLQATPMPRSGHAEHGGHGGGGAADPAALAGFDRVEALLRSHGWPRAHRLFAPVGAEGVYTAYTYPDRPEGQRTLYVDRHSLRPIGNEIRFADYGAAGRAIELGVQIHMGHYFGRANQLLMLLPCIGIWVLVVSGVAMWWKRRPAGRVAPPPRTDRPPSFGLLAIVAAACVVMPLFGASVLLLAAVDGACVAATRRYRAAA